MRVPVTAFRRRALGGLSAPGRDTPPIQQSVERARSVAASEASPAFFQADFPRSPARGHFAGRAAAADIRLTASLTCTYTSSTALVTFGTPIDIPIMVRRRRGRRGTGMKRRMVVPGLLICAAISVTGCWIERDAYGKLRIYGRGEFRARERYLERTEPEEFAQMRRRKRTGQCLALLGGAGLAYGFVYHTGPQHQHTESRSNIAVGAVLGGAVALLVGGVMANSYEPYVRKQGRRRHGRLLIAPNGCLLTYRF